MAEMRREEKFIYFGSFPQSKKAPDVVIVGGGENPDGYPVSRFGYYPSLVGAYHGLYTGSDGAKYAKIVGGGSCDCGFYKIEPLKWRMIGREGGGTVLLCENVILKMAFHGDSNDYESSGVRHWLNNEFYGRAFTEEEKTRIAVTHIKRDGKDVFGVDTYDRVFLLSREEVFHKFGLNHIDRQKFSTPYAVATGAVKGNGGAQWWWLRTPYPSSLSLICAVTEDGEEVASPVDRVSIGVVPALTVRLNEE